MHLAAGVLKRSLREISRELGGWRILRHAIVDVSAKGLSVQGTNFPFDTDPVGRLRSIRVPALWLRRILDTQRASVGVTLSRQGGVLVIETPNARFRLLSVGAIPPWVPRSMFDPEKSK